MHEDAPWVHFIFISFKGKLLKEIRQKEREEGK
jgi:hypothetical protein